MLPFAFTVSDGTTSDGRDSRCWIHGSKRNGPVADDVDWVLPRKDTSFIHLTKGRSAGELPQGTFDAMICLSRMSGLLIGRSLWAL